MGRKAKISVPSPAFAGAGLSTRRRQRDCSNGLNRREFIKAVGLGAASLLLPGCIDTLKPSTDRVTTKKPNIIFIIADDMGYGDLGCYNENSKIPTPNMDRMPCIAMRSMFGVGIFEFSL